MKFLKKQKGSAILITFLILGVLLISALSITFVTIQEFKASQSASKTTATYQVADEGVEAVMYEIIQAGYSQIDELHYCQSNGKIGGEIFGYEVTLLDRNEEMLHCGDDGSSPLSDIKKIKSVGTLAGQNQRSVVAFVPMACNGENDDEYTKLLLHFDGGDTGDEFVDATDNHSIDTEGDPEITRDEKVFCKSVHLNGEDDDLEISDSSDWDFGADDFTIDFWIYPTNLDDGKHRIYSQQTDSSSNYFFIRTGSKGTNADNKLFFNSDVGVTLEDSDDLEEDTWYHVALVRNGNEITLYKNGESVDSTSYDGIFSDISAKLNIGCLWGNSEYFEGYIDEFRISKGAARWTDDFDPPVYPY